SRGGIGGGFNRWKLKIQRTIPARRQNSLQAQPYCPWVSALRTLYCLAGYGLGLAVQQSLGRAGGLIAQPRRPSSRVARRPFPKWASTLLFCCIISGVFHD